MTLIVYRGFEADRIPLRMDQTRVKFGRRLKFLREARGLSQQELSFHANLDRSYISDVERGTRNISLENIVKLAAALNVEPYMLFLEDSGLLDRLDISVEELENLIDANPSLRGFIIGYLAEAKLTARLAADSRITKLVKFDDHDRTNKHDLVITYRGKEFTIEIKSLQSATVRACDGRWFTGAEVVAKFQCDASDRRTVLLADGSSVTTTCLRYGDFDIIAVNLFAFEKGWQYGFALNRDLPHSTYRKYPAEVQKLLIKSLVPISHPLQPPFTDDLFRLLDVLYRERYP